MPQIPKKKIIALIEHHIEGFQALLDKRVVDIQNRINENTLYHSLWTFCTELLDFKYLGLITYDEFGHYMYRLGEIVKEKPDLKIQVHRAIHLAAGNDPFFGVYH